MYKNFSEYWNDKKDLFLKLGVCESAARMIWSDAADCLASLLTKALDDNPGT
jgi:hypothetical protein